MSQVAAAPRPGNQSPISRIWDRNLDHYPTMGPRIVFLAIVVLATIVLYYQYYVPGGVSTIILAKVHMTFRYYVNIIVVSALFGAFASLLAGFSDRFGRANIVVYGLLVVSLIQLIALPNAGSKLIFGVEVVAVGFVEGVILVATPALVRDFSPQLGRATAMGFWTIGPVAGSLAVSLIATRTVHGGDWQQQFIISGVVGLVMFVIAFLFLRELSPAMRDQLMVSSRDQALIEARARGLDIRTATVNPWRQMFRWNLVGSAFAISVFLLIYYAAAGFFVIFFTTVFKQGSNLFTVSQANGIDTWFWAFDIGGLIVVGVVSDRLRVRKPFMVVGAIGALIMTIIFLQSAGNSHTGYYTLVIITSLLAIFLAIAYAPWMAAYTETVEDRNPALVATGIAVWAWIIRLVVAASSFALPFVVTSASPVVDNVAVGQQAQLIQKAHPALIAIVQKNPALFAKLSQYASPTQIPPTLLAQAVQAAGGGAKGTQNLLAINKIKPQLLYLQKHSTQIAALQKGLAQSPSQWQHWYWVTVGGIVVFIPFIWLTRGRWSPAKAKQDALDHERRVEDELSRLAASGSSLGSGTGGPGGPAGGASPGRGGSGEGAGGGAPPGSAPI